MATQALTTVNGVDVGALKDVIQKIRQSPNLGKFQLRVHNEWLDGGRNRSTIKEFYGVGREDTTRNQPFVLHCDEPKVMLGQDTAPNPVEYLLHALAGCVTSTLVYHAAARGIEIESVESSLEGDIDVRGFLGLSDDVPRGYKTIRVTLRVKSDAPAEKLLELAKYSPVYNSVAKSVPIDLKIEKV